MTLNTLRSAFNLPSHEQDTSRARRIKSNPPATFSPVALSDFRPKRELDNGEVMRQLVRELVPGVMGPSEADSVKAQQEVHLRQEAVDAQSRMDSQLKVAYRKVYRTGKCWSWVLV